MKTQAWVITLTKTRSEPELWQTVLKHHQDYGFRKSRQPWRRRRDQIRTYDTLVWAALRPKFATVLRTGAVKLKPGPAQGEHMTLHARQSLARREPLWVLMRPGDWTLRQQGGSAACNSGQAKLLEAIGMQSPS